MTIDILQHETNEPLQESEENLTLLADKITELLDPSGDNALKTLEQAERALRIASTLSEHAIHATQYANKLAEVRMALGELSAAAGTTRERQLGSVALSGE